MAEKSKIQMASILTVPVSGALGIAAALMRGPTPLPGTNPDAWVSAVTGSLYLASQILTIIAYIFPFFGFWAIYEYLSGKPKAKVLAFWGFMLSIIGTSLALPTLGIFSFAGPLLAERYLVGEQHLADIIMQVAVGPPAIVNISGGTLYLIGTLLLGIAIWRTDIFPRWSGLFIALHGLLLVFGFTFFPILIASWLLFLISGIGFFYYRDEP